MLSNLDIEALKYLAMEILSVGNFHKFMLDFDNIYKNASIYERLK